MEAIDSRLEQRIREVRTSIGVAVNAVLAAAFPLVNLMG